MRETQTMAGRTFSVELFLNFYINKTPFKSVSGLLYVRISLERCTYTELWDLNVTSCSRPVCVLAITGQFPLPRVQSPTVPKSRDRYKAYVYVLMKTFRFSFLFLPAGIPVALLHFLSNDV